ncbi:hypothetical protein Bca101_099870 [Brassica carinata]
MDDFRGSRLMDDYRSRPNQIHPGRKHVDKHVTNTCIQRKEEEDTRRTPRHRLHASTDQSFSPEIHLVGAATDTGNLPGPESPSTKTPVSDHTPSFLCSKCCRASIAYRDLIQTFCHKPKTKEVYPDQKH